MNQNVKCILTYLTTHSKVCSFPNTSEVHTFSAWQKYANWNAATVTEKNTGSVTSASL